MDHLLTGQFFGQTNKILNLDGITLTDTIYTHDKVDWHYHENAYFTFILKGSLIEGNKKEVNHCGAGGLLFHNCGDPHYNIKPPGTTRGFHIEVNNRFLDSLDTSLPYNTLNIHHPQIKFLIYRIVREKELNDRDTEISVKSLLLEIAAKFNEDTCSRHKPGWVYKIKDILYSNMSQNHTLTSLAAELNLHPVHISRDFRKYFNCGLGEYVRMIRVEKAMALLTIPDKPLTEITYECGFYDQSHFIKCFREFNKITPSLHQKILNG